MSDISWGAVWAAIGTLFGAFFTGLFAWMSQRGKNDSDRDMAVIAQWEKLTKALTDRIDKLEREVLDLRTENEGLLATIRQNSQSTAHLIGSSPVINDRGSDGL